MTQKYQNIKLIFLGLVLQNGKHPKISALKSKEQANFSLLDVVYGEDKRWTHRSSSRLKRCRHDQIHEKIS